MRRPEEKELVALHLSRHNTDEAVSSDPDARSAVGIGEAIGLGETVSAHIELLTTLSSMREAGLIREDIADGQDRGGDRKVYELTDAGQDLARGVERRVADEEIHVVRNDEETTVPVSAIEQRLPEISLPEALAGLSTDGTVHIREASQPEGGLADREAERDTIQARLDAVVAGDVRTVIVSGESGIGKTTLVEHTLAVARERGFEVLEGVAREETTEPYQPVRDALSPRREAIPERLFDVEAGSPDPDLGDLANRRKELFYAVSQRVKTWTEEHPLVLFIDDLHFADPGSLGLFAHVGRTLGDASVLLVGAFRPEELWPDHPLEQVIDTLDADDVHLEIGPLALADTRDLIEQTLDERSVPASFVETIHERTAGHPLFVEATVSHLREAGIIDPGADHYPANPDATLPERVRVAIDRRLAALDDATRAVLDAASVIGSTFDFRELAALTDVPETDLREYVELLAAARIWVRSDDANTGDRFEFVNQVVRDAIYDELSEASRCGYHARVAEALETVAEDEAAVPVGRIAPHYERAGDTARAIHYYRQAGGRAAAVYAYETAVDSFERALSLARQERDEDTAVALLKHIAEIYLNSDAFADAERYFEYLLDHTDDPEIHREIAANRALIRNRQGAFEDAVAIVDETLADWDRETPTPQVRNLLTRKAWSRYWRGDVTAARELGERQLALAEALEDPAARADALNALARIEKSHGEFDHAIDLLEEAVADARAAGAKRHEAFSKYSLGVIHARRDVERAEELFEECLALHRETNTPYGMVAAISHIGDCLDRRGDWEAALARFEEALERGERLDTEQFVAANLIRIGRVRLNRGELALARESLDRGLEIAENLDHRQFVEEAHVAFARLELSQANFAAGETHADRVIDSVGPGRVEMIPEAYAVKGWLRLAQADVEGARTAFGTGLEKAQDLHNVAAIVSNRRGLAETAGATGDRSTAIDDAAAACAVATEQANPLLPIEAAFSFARVNRTGDPERVEEALGRALERSRELGASVHEGIARYELGRLQDDSTSASETLAKALEIAERTGATFLVQRCEAALTTVSNES